MKKTLNSRKFHIIIQARMASKRLPGKALKTLNGRPALWHIYQRCLDSKFAKRVIVATTTEKEDDRIATFCQKNKIPFYRGSANNVLARFYHAAEKFGSEVIARITGDCPLIDSRTIDRCFLSFIRQKSDYLSNVVPGERTFPRGLDVEIFSFAALGKAFSEASAKMDKEHVTPYIWQNKKNEYRIGKIVTATKLFRRSYRLTVDYPEDLAVMSIVYEKFSGRKIIPTELAIKFLDEHPEIASLNRDCEKKHYAYALANRVQKATRNKNEKYYYSIAKG